MLICADVIRPSLGWLLTCRQRRGPGRRDGPRPRSRGVRRAGRVVPVRTGQERTPGWLRSARSRPSWPPRAACRPASPSATACELLDTSPGRAPGQTGTPAARSSTSCCAPGACSAQTPRGDAGARRPRAADLRAADRPLRHRLPAGPRPAGRLPARTPARRWTTPPCSSWPTCSASCSGATWRPTIPASAR